MQIRGLIYHMYSGHRYQVVFHSVTHGSVPDDAKQYWVGDTDEFMPPVIPVNGLMSGSSVSPIQYSYQSRIRGIFPIQYSYQSQI